VLTNRERLQFESNSYPAGGVFLTLTESRLSRAAHVTFGTIQESAGSTDTASPRTTLCQDDRDSNPPLVLCQCPQAHPYYLQDVTYHSIPGLNCITRIHGRNDLSGQLSVRLRSTRLKDVQRISP
jgi:hypothetical protein